MRAKAKQLGDEVTTNLQETLKSRMAGQDKKVEA
jgi:hypothetical protein